MSESSTSPVPAHDTGTQRVKRGLAEMLKGGVIMDVVDATQAKIAEDAGAGRVFRRLLNHGSRVRRRRAAALLGDDR